MRTPGRCTNTEGCWISASHRSVWLSVGEDFVCPNCGGNLSAPLPQTRSFRAVKRAAAFGAIASVSLTVAALGMVKLSTVSWPGQSVAATVVQAPAALLKATFSPKATPVEVAEVPLPVKPPTTTDYDWAKIVANNAPTVPFGMELASGRGPGTRQATSGPLLLYPTKTQVAQRSAALAVRMDEQRAIAAASQVHSAVVTLVSRAVLVPDASSERPLVVPISVGRPLGPETDAEPVTRTWHHHSMGAARRSGFLPAPAAATTPQAGPDALAQICRIPSLMH